MAWVDRCRCRRWPASRLTDGTTTTDSSVEVQPHRLPDRRHPLLQVLERLRRSALVELGERRAVPAP